MRLRGHSGFSCKRLGALDVENASEVVFGQALQAGAGPNPARQAARIDVEGAVILPGLVDSHAHIQELGRETVQANLVGSPDEEDAIEASTREHSETPHFRDSD